MTGGNDSFWSYAFGRPLRAMPCTQLTNRSMSPLMSAFGRSVNRTTRPTATAAASDTVRGRPSRVIKFSDALLADELLRVPHVRVDARLHDREQLSRVVAVVMHPLLQKILHAEGPDLRILAAPLEVRGRERAHQRDAVVPETHELHPQALAHPRAIIALTRDHL